MTTRYDIYDGTTFLVSAPTLREIRQKAKAWTAHWIQEPLITKVTLTPDGGTRTTAPTPAGTWGGTCGSSLWVDDPHFTIAFRQDRRFGTHQTSQAHHEHWVINDRPSNFPPEERAERALGGFRVECEGKHRHEGLCSAGPFRWTWEHAADGRENSARRSGVARLDLVGQR